MLVVLVDGNVVVIEVEVDEDVAVVAVDLVVVDGIVVDVVMVSGTTVVVVVDVQVPHITGQRSCTWVFGQMSIRKVFPQSGFSGAPWHTLGVYVVGFAVSV